MDNCPYFSQCTETSTRQCVFHFDGCCQQPDLSFEDMDAYETNGVCFAPEP